MNERVVKRSPERAPMPELGESEHDEVQRYDRPADPPPEPEPGDELNPEPEMEDEVDDVEDHDDGNLGDADPTSDISDDEIDRLARSMGWRPRDQWRGDPADWRDAREFYRRAISSAALHHKSLAAIQEQNQNLREKVDELGKVVKDINEERKRAQQAGYDQAMRELKEKRDRAVEEADTEAFNEAEEAIKNLTPPGAEPAPPAPAEPDLDEATKSTLHAWKAKNEWFDTDAVMTNLALAQHNQLLKDQPNLTLEQNLAEVSKEVRRRFPEKFRNERRDTPAVTGATGKRDGSRSGTPGRSYDDLPAEAKAACDRFVKNIPGYTRKEYLASYPWDKVGA